MAALFNQTHVDATRLSANIRSVVPRRSSAWLRDIVDVCPIEQGAAEIVAYLALDDGDIRIELDETTDMVLDYEHREVMRRVRMPRVRVTRA